jgi:hypothetical protein
MATVSFANDIAPTLYKYRGQMAWRPRPRQLRGREGQRCNHPRPNQRLDGVFMPPPPFDPFPQSFIDAFSDWMNNGYPP